MQASICGPSFCSAAAQKQVPSLPEEGRWCCASCEQAASCPQSPEERKACGLNQGTHGSNCPVNPTPNSNCDVCTVQVATKNGDPVWTPQGLPEGDPRAQCPYGQTLYWGCCPDSPSSAPPSTAPPTEYEAQR